jgi:multidrug efflux pump subunit AcrB
VAFIPLTHSVFWGSMAYALIGGTAVGTVLILLFLPALYAAWFGSNQQQTMSVRTPFGRAN